MNNNKNSETICLKRPPKMDSICQVNENQLSNDIFPSNYLDDLKELKRCEMYRANDQTSLFSNPLIIEKKDNNTKGFIDKGKPWIKSVINIKQKFPTKNKVVSIKPTISNSVKREKSENFIQNPLINVKIKHKKANSNINEPAFNSNCHKSSRNKLEKVIVKNYPFLAYAKRNNSYLPKYLNPIMNLNTIIINTSKFHENELPQIVGKSLNNFNIPNSIKNTVKTLSSFHLTDRSEKNNTLSSFNKAVINSAGFKKLTNPSKDNLINKDKITVFSKKSNKLL